MWGLTTEYDVDLPSTESTDNKPSERNWKPTELFENILYRVKRLAVNLDHVVQMGSCG